MEKANAGPDPESPTPSSLFSKPNPSEWLSLSGIVLQNESITEKGAFSEFRMHFADQDAEANVFP